MRIRCRGEFNFSRVAVSGTNPEQRQGRDRSYKVSLGIGGLRETGQLESPAVFGLVDSLSRSASRAESATSALGTGVCSNGLSFFVCRHLAGQAAISRLRRHSFPLRPERRGCRSFAP
jgi:hypothetical protein